jgi:hypothetical protein
MIKLVLIGSLLLASSTLYADEALESYCALSRKMLSTPKVFSPDAILAVLLLPAWKNIGEKKILFLGQNIYGLERYDTIEIAQQKVEELQKEIRKVVENLDERVKCFPQDWIPTFSASKKILLEATVSFDKYEKGQYFLYLVFPADTNPLNNRLVLPIIRDALGTPEKIETQRHDTDTGARSYTNVIVNYMDGLLQFKTSHYAPDIDGYLIFQQLVLDVDLLKHQN